MNSLIAAQFAELQHRREGILKDLNAQLERDTKREDIDALERHVNALAALSLEWIWEEEAHE